MKNIKPRNQKGQQHGYWEMYYTNGSIGLKSFYYNGKPHGYSEYYWKNELDYKKYHI